MRVIKKYANRKLYDTEARRYVTLDIVGTLIADGHEVVIMDQATGDDITAATLGTTSAAPIRGATRAAVELEEEDDAFSESGPQLRQVLSTALVSGLMLPFGVGQRVVAAVSPRPHPELETLRDRVDTLEEEIAELRAAMRENVAPGSR